MLIAYGVAHNGALAAVLLHQAIGLLVPASWRRDRLHHPPPSIRADKAHRRQRSRDTTNTRPRGIANRTRTSALANIAKARLVRHLNKAGALPTLPGHLPFARSPHPALAAAVGPGASGGPLERVPDGYKRPRKADRSNSTRDRVHPDPATPAPSRALDHTTPFGQREPRDQSGGIECYSPSGGVRASSVPANANRGVRRSDRPHSRGGVLALPRKK